MLKHRSEQPPLLNAHPFTSGSVSIRIGKRGGEERGIRTKVERGEERRAEGRRTSTRAVQTGGVEKEGMSMAELRKIVLDSKQRKG